VKRGTAGQVRSYPLRSDRCLTVLPGTGVRLRPAILPTPVDRDLAGKVAGVVAGAA
jgi:hypothetical protein